eukprot:5490680-Amphidinium_carterae.1
MRKLTVAVLEENAVSPDNIAVHCASQAPAARVAASMTDAVQPTSSHNHELRIFKQFLFPHVSGMFALK